MLSTRSQVATRQPAADDYAAPPLRGPRGNKSYLNPPKGHKLNLKQRHGGGQAVEKSLRFCRQREARLPAIDDRKTRSQKATKLLAGKEMGHASTTGSETG